MKLPILGRLPPPVKAMQSVGKDVHVYCMCIQEIQEHWELFCLFSWYKTSL